MLSGLAVGVLVVVSRHRHPHRLGSVAVGDPLKDHAVTAAVSLAAGENAALGFDADVRLFAAVLPAAIEAVWVPGMAEYDRFAELPR